MVCLLVFLFVQFSSFFKPHAHCCNCYERSICDALLLFLLLLTTLKVAHLLRKKKYILCIRIDSIQFISISAMKSKKRKPFIHTHKHTRSVKEREKVEVTENRMQLNINRFSMLHIRDFFFVQIVTVIYSPNFNQNIDFGLSPLLSTYIWITVGFHECER